MIFIEATTFTKLLKDYLSDDENSDLQQFLVIMNIRKRNLFDELKKGVEEVAAHKIHKITLRSHNIKKRQRLKVDAELIKEVRENLHMSQSVFAIKLHVSPRTLEKWEQGETVPNDQAAALILMVKKYPDTLKRLENI